MFLMLQLFQADLSPWLEFNREAIANGQWWRLVTGHWLHTNSWHLMMNLGGFVLIICLHGMYYNGKVLLSLLLVGSLCTGLGLFWLSPSTEIYVGLSGFLHALLVCGCLIDIRRHWSSGWLILIATFGKVFWEQLHGASQDVATLIAADVAIDAHLFGACTGLLLFGGWCLHARQAQVQQIHLS
jgi:rhomboid family GlyGly-CTERM serine protease